MPNTDVETISDVPSLGEAPMIGVKPEKARPQSAEEFEKLAPGTEFVDPEGVTRKKPYMPKSEADFAAVPEGAQFVDPEGALREKPKYEGVDFTAQTLFDMALTPKEKRKALERSYPGKVKEGPDGLYIEDEGTFRKPGRGVTAATGFMAGVAAPTVGSVLGTLGGGAIGAAGGPAGAFVAGTMGGGTGAMLGQGFNDFILQLAGVYDRTPGEEAGNLAVTGLTGMAGAGVGRGVSTVVPSIKAGISKAGVAAPGVARYFLGTKEEPAKQALRLQEEGVLVPTSRIAPEAPMLNLITDVFDPAFRGDVQRESAVKYYEKKASEILDKSGVKYEGSLLKPTAEAPLLEAGEKIKEKTLSQVAAADRALQEALDAREAEIKAGVTPKLAQREEIMSAAEASQKAARKLLDEGFEDINRDIETAYQVAKVDGRTGDLWQHVGNKLQAIRFGIGQRAKYWYDRYDQMTGGAKASSVELSASAQDMLDQLPAEFKSRNPSLVQQLAALAGEKTNKAGEVTKQATTELTYGQLHDLRSIFRNSADWQTLTSDFKNGALKRFSNEIDRLIHDPEAPEHVRAAGKFLDMVDKWYAHNIKVFNAKEINAVMRGLEAGEPADPANLYKAIVRPGQSDLIKRIQKMVGPNLWAGVQAADTQAMMDASKTLIPGSIDGKKFASEVLERSRNNLLEAVHGEKSAKLIKQATAIEQLEGRLDIPVSPGDSMTQVMQRARLTEEAAKIEAKQDPLSTLNKEIAKARLEKNAAKKSLNEKIRNDPLGFLYDPSTGGMEAAQKILANEDLILAAAARFGEQSEQFELLRQIWVRRLFENTLLPGKKLGATSEQVQHLMLPGITLDETRQLAKDMDFLLGSTGRGRNTGASMAAVSRIVTPVHVGGVLGFLAGGPVGAAAGAAAGLAIKPVSRAALGKFYALVTSLMNKPTTTRFLIKGLQGTPEEREAVRHLTDAVLQKGAGVGAGAAVSTEQGSSL